MHELSIALGLVESASDEVRRRGLGPVEALHLRIGRASGVLPDALRFGWTVATEGTTLAGSRLEIVEVPAALHCSACGEEREVESAWSMRCPACGSLATRLVRGRELDLVGLDVADPPAPGRMQG
ncbi:MAG TPA: hydrogenase maturation nickel metallochaperone HypA [Thermoanaerobaculia bacterium]|nr:hydrogenase maturation nickel metallochaperone HypA [Thermoanaerobaculia bacterium]